MTSILDSTKKALGIPPTVTAFDPELIMFINSVLSDMTQLGIGPDTGYAITDNTATWEDFLVDELRYNSAQTYMFLSVRLLFDPPNVGYVLTSMEKLRDEAAWRLNVKREDIVHPPPLPEDIEDEDFVIDGGTPSD